MNEDKEKCKTCKRVVAREEITETGCLICNEQDEGSRYEEMKEKEIIDDGFEEAK